MPNNIMARWITYPPWYATGGVRFIVCTSASTAVRRGSNSTPCPKYVKASVNSWLPGR